jgi:hypothetical protein
MSIDECRIKEFFLFYMLKIAERSDIHSSSIVNRHLFRQDLQDYQDFFGLVWLYPVHLATRGEAF